MSRNCLWDRDGGRASQLKGTSQDYDGDGNENVKNSICLKAHLQPVCIAVVHFNEIISRKTEITTVLIVFENRIASS